MRTSIKILITIFCFIILVGGGAITFSILSKPPSLCSNFNCPTGTERDLSKVIGNTKEECCRPISCSNFKCPTGTERVINFSKVNGNTAQECCRPIGCISFQDCPTGQVKNRRANGITAKECCVDSCEEITCPPEFPVRDPYMWRTDPSVKKGETPDFCCKKGSCAGVSCPGMVKNPSIFNYINSKDECCNR